MASAAEASGSLPSVCWGSSGGTDRVGDASLSLSPAALEAASVRRDSDRAEEMFRLRSTPASALPLVRHSGRLVQVVSQVKALVPTSSASTARRE